MEADSKIKPSKVPAPGWIGGFSTSNRKFAYPNPDLSPLPMLCNMANIPFLRRQVDVLWPEFSWEAVIGDPNSRCYQMFAPDISRAGYDDAGRIWSIICPQQGVVSKVLGSLNIEVTVNTQRGWMDETADAYQNLLAADMTVTGKVWFGSSVRDRFEYKLLKAIFDKENLPFPDQKANAIQVMLHEVGNPDQPTLPIRSGLSTAFPNPDFALHYHEAWGAGNVAVQIGPIQTLNNALVDDFNALVMDIFNLASGNILKQGNVLSWNVWFDAPTIVDQTEWRDHAEKWRRSIDTDHGSPDGPGTVPRYFDGTPFSVVDTVAEEEWEKIKAWIKKHVGWLSALKL